MPLAGRLIPSVGSFFVAYIGITPKAFFRWVDEEPAKRPIYHVVAISLVSLVLEYLGTLRVPASSFFR